ncbi:MAG: hypothetical protein IH849_12225 [Acidobacteria bacterium]|nr:hypothetical protein [Acidobacteriota bacterium]
MADLTYVEKRKLEQLFEMAGGYVLDFSNRTFEDFVFHSVRINIYQARYGAYGNSKANRLRTFWRLEPNHVVGKLIADLVNLCWAEFSHDHSEEPRDECSAIAQRLIRGATLQDASAISPNAEGRDFELLAREVRDSIDKNEPEIGLDRLHAFVVKYIRVLCEKRGIRVGRDVPLHGAFGMYVKAIEEEGLVESDMAVRILKSSVSAMEASNWARNDRSLGHPNPVLGRAECLLIFNNVASTIRFIEHIEGAVSTPSDEDDQGGDAVTDDGLPF